MRIRPPFSRNPFRQLSAVLLCGLLLISCASTPVTAPPGTPPETPGAPPGPPPPERPPPQPPTPPPGHPPVQSPAAWLALINEARAQARTCGTRWHPAAPPLALEPQLTEAAQDHSTDMARAGRISHEVKPGKNLRSRLVAAGYPYRAAGENIAAGQRSFVSALSGWLHSPGHCENLMNPVFTETGLAVARDSQGQLYWTQVLAAPLSR